LQYISVALNYFQVSKIVKKEKLFTIDASEDRRTVATTLNLDTGWKRAVSFRSQLLCAVLGGGRGGSPQVPIEYEAVWAPKLGWTL
jgi:hypothetical protein